MPEWGVHSPARCLTAPVVLCARVPTHTCCACTARAQEVREPEVREAFKRLHAAYIDAVCNPFQGHEQPLHSAAFGAAVDALARQLRGPAPSS